jgi:hypothetical protein
MFTPDQKHQHAASRVKLTEDDTDGLSRILPSDNSRYDPEIKGQSATWSSPKKPKAQRVRIPKLWLQRVDCPLPML